MKKGFHQSTEGLSGNTSKPDGHPWPSAVGQAAGSALGKETGWLIGKANSPGPCELQLTHKGMLCACLSLPAAQLDGGPERLTLAQGTRAGKATSCLREGSRTGCYVRGCALLCWQPAPGDRTRQCDTSLTLKSGSRQPTTTPGRESLSCLCAPGLPHPGEPVATMLEKDLSRLHLPRALLLGNGLRLS